MKHRAGSLCLVGSIVRGRNVERHKDCRGRQRGRRMARLVLLTVV